MVLYYKSFILWRFVQGKTYSHLLSVWKLYNPVLDLSNRNRRTPSKGYICYVTNVTKSTGTVKDHEA